MEYGWWIVLIVSLVLLVVVVYRTKPDPRMFGFALVQLVIAAVILYVMNGTGWFGDFYIPINVPTILTIAILGLPGLALLAAVKLTILV